jgi:hypothetical protein
MAGGASGAGAAVPVSRDSELQAVAATAERRHAIKAALRGWTVHWPAPPPGTAGPVAGRRKGMSDRRGCVHVALARLPQVRRPGEPELAVGGRADPRPRRSRGARSWLDSAPEGATRSGTRSPSAEELTCGIACDVLAKRAPRAGGAGVPPAPHAAGRARSPTRRRCDARPPGRHRAPATSRTGILANNSAAGRTIRSHGPSARRGWLTSTGAHGARFTSTRMSPQPGGRPR